MALKKCKECGAEISSDAKVCPKCGKKQKGSVLRVVLGILIVIIGIGMIAGGTSTNNTSTNNADSTTSSSTVTESVVTKENYDKITEGMTKEEVKSILGEPTSVSESSTPGVGTMELNHYQEGFSLKAIDVYYLKDKVYMKNWTEL